MRTEIRKFCSHKYDHLLRFVGCSQEYGGFLRAEMCTLVRLWLQSVASCWEHYIDSVLDNKKDSVAGLGHSLESRMNLDHVAVGRVLEETM